MLFTGDAVAPPYEGRTILGVFNVDPAQAADSLNKLGHGEPVTHNAATELKAAAGR